MSFSFTGSACNMTAYYPLTTSNVGSTGTISLTGLDLPSAGCVTRFWATGLNQGATTYQFDNYAVSLNGASNTIYATYAGSNLGSNAYSFGASSNQITVKYAPNQSNTTLACYVDSTLALSTVSSNVGLSNSTHSWTGLNTTASSKSITTPLVQNVISFYNNVNIQNSLRVASNATIVGNLTVTGTLNFTSASSVSGQPIVGNARFGDFGFGSSLYTGFNHVSLPYTGANYAFLCSSGGDTLINSASSLNSIYFRQSNLTMASLNNYTLSCSNIASSNISVNSLSSTTLSNSGTAYVGSLQASGGTIGSMAISAFGLSGFTGWNNAALANDSGHYAMIQGNTGDIYVNTPASTNSTTFRYGNSVNIAVMNSTGLTVTAQTQTATLKLSGASYAFSNASLQFGSYAPTCTAVSGSYTFANSSARWNICGNVCSIVGCVNLNVTANFSAPLAFTVSLPVTAFSYLYTNFSTGIVSGNTSLGTSTVTNSGFVQPYSTSAVQLWYNLAEYSGTTLNVYYDFKYVVS